MDALTVIRRHYDAAAKGDVAGMFADFASDGEFIESALPAPGTYVGADAVLTKLFPALGTVYENFRFVLEHLVAAGETAIALGWYEAIVRASGKAVRIRVCHAWTVKNGQIKRFEQIADTLTVSKALGS